MNSRRPAIKGVIFDFGRVLCEFDIQRFVAVAAEHSSLGADEFAARVPQTMPVAHAYEAGDLSSDQFFAEVSRIAALNMRREEFKEAYSDIFTPIESTWEVVRRLKGKYRLGLLSNTNEWHYERGIKTVPVFPLFESVTLSYVVHAMKPDPRIYRAALASMRLEPEACIYIDDLEENVTAARALGMRAFRYVSHDQLLDDLISAGIKTLHD
jgi:epoxide hydrolase-like predicted phosphatase